MPTSNHSESHHSILEDSILEDSAAEAEIAMESDRLLFRRFTAADAPLIYDLDSDPAVMEFISKGKPTPLDRIEQVVLPEWLSFYERPGCPGLFATYEAASREFMGWFCLKPDRLISEIELGYRLKQKFWGKGYGTEGSRFLLQQAFEVWDIPQVTSHTLAYNTRSRRVMEKCGLQFQYPFIYPETLLPGWSEGDRQAVRYGISRETWLMNPTLSSH